MFSPASHGLLNGGTRAIYDRASLLNGKSITTLFNNKVALARGQVRPAASIGTNLRQNGHVVVEISRVESGEFE